jgi:hypothetical protein
MESQRFRLTLLALAAVLAAGFFLATRGYWVAADPGVDENAYLVSGKLLAQTGSPGFVPPDLYSLVGKMWIGTREGRFYPKYPLGQTLLVALAVKTAGLRGSGPRRAGPPRRAAGRDPVGLAAAQPPPLHRLLLGAPDRHRQLPALLPHHPATPGAGSGLAPDPHLA